MICRPWRSWAVSRASNDWSSSFGDIFERAVLPGPFARRLLTSELRASVSNTATVGTRRVDLNTLPRGRGAPQASSRAKLSVWLMCWVALALEVTRANYPSSDEAGSESCPAYHLDPPRSHAVRDFCFPCILDQSAARRPLFYFLIKLKQPKCRTRGMHASRRVQQIIFIRSSDWNISGGRTQLCRVLLLLNHSLLSLFISPFLLHSLSFS
jgi:hypothetical protein